MITKLSPAKLVVKLKEKRLNVKILVDRIDGESPIDIITTVLADRTNPRQEFNERARK